jgi:hypothetical protein
MTMPDSHHGSLLTMDSGGFHDPFCSLYHISTHQVPFYRAIFNMSSAAASSVRWRWILRLIGEVIEWMIVGHTISEPCVAISITRWPCFYVLPLSVAILSILISKRTSNALHKIRSTIALNDLPMSIGTVIWWIVRKSARKFIDTKVDMYNPRTNVTSHSTIHEPNFKSLFYSLLYFVKAPVT